MQHFSEFNCCILGIRHAVSSKVRCKFENSKKVEIQIQPQSLFATQVQQAINGNAQRVRCRQRARHLHGRPHGVRNADDFLSVYLSNLIVSYYIDVILRSVKHFL